MDKIKSVLVTDSREQKRLEFRPDIFDKYEVGALSFGDYGLFLYNDKLEAKQVPLVFERKGLGDLFGTMTGDYERWKRCMARCKEADFHMILLIEGSMQDVWQGYKHSQFSGESMLKKLAMLRVRYDLEYHFCNTRREMARLIEDVFSAVVRNWSADAN